jgi:TRAP-type C4-dicarboxylate transport system substrate-binding protein
VGRTGSGVDPISLKAYEAAPDELLGRLAQSSDKSPVVITAVPLPDGDRDYDNEALAALAAGSLDIAAIRSGRLVTEGAASLSPLGAPFLVTNNDQAIAIARDSIVEDLSADLPKIGLVGVGLIPIGTRRPFGFGKPLLGADDYAHQVINARVDEGVKAMLEALGATVDSSSEQERTAKVKSGKLRGIEASFQNMAAVDRPAVVTTNVTLYERFDVVVVRKPAWDALTDSQREGLQAAVAHARDDTFAAMGTDSKLIGEFCLTGGSTSAAANAADLASLHSALDPVAAAVEAQYPTVVARLRELHAGTTDVTGLSCPTDNRPSWAQLAPKGDQGVLDGTWRFANDEADLVAAGLSASDAHGNAGVWEMTVTDGKAQLALNGGRPCSSTFTFADDQVVFLVGPEEWCGGYVAGTYKLDGDTATFRWAEAGDAYGLVLGNGLFHQAVRVQQ